MLEDKDPEEQLAAHFEAEGMKCRIVNVGRVKELQADIENNHSKNLFDETFFNERLKRFSFQLNNENIYPKSIIIAAIPSALTKVVFSFRGKEYPLILPPTYCNYSLRKEKAFKHLLSFLIPLGYKAFMADLPEKLLAVRSGMAEYGRNNITYVKEMGSFYSPAAFYSDMPCDTDCWCEPKMMDRCGNCLSCIIKCPAGAISSERFLLHAEKCLVFHNERAPGIPFPEWIDPAWHNAVVGCMTCQQYCPEDKPFLNWFEGNETFSDEETSQIMEGVPFEELSSATKEKLERLELVDYYKMLPRNLGVLLV
jgi:epoxyqueuosine reductase